MPDPKDVVWRFLRDARHRGLHGDRVRFLREYMDSDYAHSVSAGAGGAGGADGRVPDTLKRLGHD
jgi:hypothetical protein